MIVEVGAGIRTYTVGEHELVDGYAEDEMAVAGRGLALSVEYALSETGLRVTASATNVGRHSCPYGTGAHPYLTVGTETVDSVLLRAPGRTMLHADDRGIPTGSAPVEGTEFDFRRLRPIGGTKLDNAYTDLERDADGRAHVELRHPTADRPSRSGSTTATATSSSSPAIRNRASTAAASPLSR